MKNPLSSCLLLHSDTATERASKLTLSDLLVERLEGSKLVVLSACSTGVTEESLTDEYVGLPAGFLYAGCETVVASLWPVDDECTTMLMREFYREMRRLTNDAPAALRAAMLWLRDSNALACPTPTSTAMHDSPPALRHERSESGG